MNIQKTATLALASALAISLLSGCTSSDDKTASDDTQSVSTVASAPADTAATTADAVTVPDNGPAAKVSVGGDWTGGETASSGGDRVWMLPPTDGSEGATLSAVTIEYSTIGVDNITAYLAATGVDPANITEVSTPAPGYRYTISTAGIGDAAGYVFDLGDGTGYVIGLFPATEQTIPMLDEVASTFTG